METVADQLAAVLRQFSLDSLLQAGGVQPRLAAVVQISATDDAFIPAADAESLFKILGSTIDQASEAGTSPEAARIVWAEGGHLSLSCDAFSLGGYGGNYLQAIRDAFCAMEGQKSKGQESVGQS